MSMRRSTLMRGWTSTVIRQQALSKKEMSESTLVFAQLLESARGLIHEHRRLVARGMREAAAALAPQARYIADAGRYTLRAWINQGCWYTYYLVPSGAVHNCIGCRTLNEHTRFRPLPHLSGDTIDQVVAQGYRVCGHCRRVSLEENTRLVGRTVHRLASALDEIAMLGGSYLRA